MQGNLVLIYLYTVRKDFFDEFAPRLQNAADISIEQCHAASAWSVSSHASMFTGELPHQHGLHTYNRDFSGLASIDTFLDDLSDHRSMGVSENIYASSAFGFDTIFDELVDIALTHRFSERLVRKFGFECDADMLRYCSALLDKI